MLGVVDFDGFFLGSVVKPEDNIAVIVVSGGGDRDWLVRIVGEDGKRAGGIESESSNRRGVDVLLIENPLDGIADAAPDVVG